MKKPMTRGRLRGNQLVKAYDWLEKVGGLVTLYIPEKGVFDAYPEDVEVLEAMYGKGKVARVVDERIEN